MHRVVVPVRHVHLVTVGRREAPRELVVRQVAVHERGEAGERVARWSGAIGRMMHSAAPLKVAVRVARPGGEVADGNLCTVPTRDALVVHRQPCAHLARHPASDRHTVLEVRALHASTRAVGKQAARALLEECCHGGLAAHVQLEGAAIVAEPALKQAPPPAAWVDHRGERLPLPALCGPGLWCGLRGSHEVWRDASCSPQAGPTQLVLPTGLSGTRSRVASSTRGPRFSFDGGGGDDSRLTAAGAVCRRHVRRLRSDRAAVSPQPWPRQPTHIADAAASMG